MTTFHDNLISTMQTRRYGVDNLGICYGTTGLFILLFLLNINVHEFNRFYIATQKAAKEKKRIPSPLPHLASYFNCITIIQAPKKHRDYLPEAYQSQTQYMTKMINLFLPASIKETMQINALKTFTSFYTLPELTDYFRCLHTSLEKIAPHEKKPFVLLLEAADHAMCVAYSPKQAFWIFFDINDTPVKKISLTTPKKLAILINKALSSPKHNTLFTTTLFCSSLDSNDLTRLLNHWTSTESFKSIHRVTKEKLSFKDLAKNSWMYTLIQNEIIPLILLKQKIDHEDWLNKLYDVWPDVINMKIGAFKKTLLHFAVKRKHLWLIDYLLRKPEIDINAQNAAGQSPLINAIEDNNTAATLALLKNEKIDINLKDNEKNLPLSLAIKMKNKTIIKALYENPRINFNEINPVDTHLLIFAMLTLDEGSQCIEKILNVYPAYLNSSVSLKKSELIDYIFNDSFDLKDNAHLEIFSQLNLLTQECPSDAIITLSPENIASILNYKNIKKFKSTSSLAAITDFSLFTQEKKRGIANLSTPLIEPPKKRVKYH